MERRGGLPIHAEESKDSAAEDVLHDLGAISMFGSDAEGMGRTMEVTASLWKLASKMRDERGPLDDQLRISDEEALSVLFDLAEQEGLLLGGSSGVNVAAAIAVARKLGPGHTVVTVLCDHGTRYQSKLFNPAFLRQKGLPVPAWLDRASPS